MNDFPNRVILTGDTDSLGRFIVRFDAHCVHLALHRFLGLLVLFNVRLCTHSGRAELIDFEAADVVYGKTSLHQLIRRIRRDLSCILGSGGGEKLVLHCGGSRYSVAVDREAICVAPAFLELERDVPPAIFRNLSALIVAPDAGTRYVNCPSCSRTFGSEA